MSDIQLDITYDGFEAYRDHMGKQLRVFGTCHIRSGGFAASLRYREPQGINPDILMLDLVVAPTGESPSEQPVRYEVDWNPGDPSPSQVSFDVVGPFEAEPPPPLPVKDVH